MRSADQDFRETLHARLTAAGAASAATVAAAAVVLLDPGANLADIDAAAAELRREAPAAKLVAILPMPHESDRRLCSAAGIDAVVPALLSDHELTSVIGP